jgi:hypothetical protein
MKILTFTIPWRREIFHKLMKKKIAAPPYAWVAMEGRSLSSRVWLWWMARVAGGRRRLGPRRRKTFSPGSKVEPGLKARTKGSLSTGVFIGNICACVDRENTTSYSTITVMTTERNAQTTPQNRHSILSPYSIFHPLNGSISPWSSKHLFSGRGTILRASLDAQGCKIQGTEATRGIYVANYNPVFSVSAFPSPPPLFGSFHRASEPPQFVPLGHCLCFWNPKCVQQENQRKFKEK